MRMLRCQGEAIHQNVIRKVLREALHSARARQGKAGEEFWGGIGVASKTARRGKDWVRKVGCKGVDGLRREERC